MEVKLAGGMLVSVLCEDDWIALTLRINSKPKQTIWNRHHGAISDGTVCDQLIMRLESLE